MRGKHGSIVVQDRDCAELARGSRSDPVVLKEPDPEYLVRLVTAAANASVNLTLDVGSPYPTPVTAAITSSLPGVVSVPASVTIPADATTVTFGVKLLAEGRAHISAVVPARTTLSASINVTAPQPPRRRAASM